ncbi:Putative BEM1-like protein [Rhizopus microsporus]|nr:Putative BEM1-like protein [Rhizopus microsporus]
MFLSSSHKRSKSLKRLTKTKISTPISTLPTQLNVPKKIIKALYDYRAQGPHELSFRKGDFFHVIGRENDTEWYEASNPATDTRGIVPVSYFQVIERTGSRPMSLSSSSTSSTEDHKQKRVYGVVMYDFAAERPDELSAQAGESIVIIAQSTKDWYVAKPISRLGGPGLIPVSFVQVRDAQTGQAVESVQLPPVEDWKKMTQLYEASSIPLGVIEQKKKDSVVFAQINSFILEGGQYWFVLYAKTARGMHRILYRLYDDFYDFQLHLLKTYPVEAGQGDRERILPYMPGPLKEVDDKVTAERQADLNRYCKELLGLPKYLSECDLVQNQLFGIHEGDIELDYDPRATRHSNEDHVKVKIIHKDDIFAIKMPVDSTLDHLRSKVFERIGFEVKMCYKDETTGENVPLEGELDMEEAFVQAIQRGKLTIITN